MEKKSTIIIDIDSLKFNYATKLFSEITSKKVELPNWNSFLKKYILFNNIISSGPFTIVADNSIITGLTPYDHGQTGWLKHSYKSIPKETITLQYVFKELGYKTVYLSDNLSRTEVTPFNFDTYDYKNTDDIINCVSKNIIGDAKNNFFYFLKLNYLHDKVCSFSGKANSKQYYKFCLDLFYKLEEFIGLLLKNIDSINIYFLTDHGIILSDDPQSRHLENITGNYLTDKTIRTFFLSPNPLGKITKFNFINESLRFNNNPYPSTNIFASILTDNDVVINNHPSKAITGEKNKIRAISIGGGLHQSPYKPCSFSITTPRFRHVIYRRIIFGFVTYYYELFDLSNDKFQLSNLWELLSENRKLILIKYYKKTLKKNKSKISPSFYSKEKILNFQKSKLSRSAKYWILKSVIGTIPDRFNIMKSRIKDRLIYLLRSGYHLSK